MHERSRNPHPLQGGVQIGSPESNRPADYEARDQVGHGPAVGVVFAHSEAPEGHSPDSSDLHPLQRRRHIRHTEAHGLAELEIRDQAGKPPSAHDLAPDVHLSAYLKQACPIRNFS
jgi:hypothetical protein